MTRLPRTLARDDRGTSLIEFAIILPVGLLLFLGGFQLSDASACKRRVTITARAVADLIAQNDVITESDVSASIAAASQIMTPYSTANAKIRVTQVSVNSSGDPKVVWSRTSSNQTPLTAGDDFIGMPRQLKQAGTYYIYSEVNYTYSLPLGNYVDPITFTQTLYMVPRKSAMVTLK